MINIIVDICYVQTCTNDLFMSIEHYWFLTYYIFVSLSLSLSTPLNTEHQNFVGFHEGLGPIVISLKREKVNPDVIHHFSHGQPSSERMSAKYQYRVILRTSEVS